MLIFKLGKSSDLTKRNFVNKNSGIQHFGSANKIVLCNLTDGWANVMENFRNEQDLSVPISALHFLCG